MSAIRVVRAGFQTTVQDLGRWGWQARGVPVAGAMDPWAHRWANACVGNPADAATLEVTLDGPEIQFDDDSVVAIAGAEFEVSINGQPIAIAGHFPVRRNDVLRLGQRGRGTRAYVAIRGGIDVPPVLGSRSTHIRCRMGGFQGRALSAGDVVPIGGDTDRARRLPKPRAFPWTIGANMVHAVRVLPGSQANRFTDEILATLQNSTFIIGAQSDRMGYRLEGPALECAGGVDIISDATPLGAIQVTASGQPVLLMADRQTTGGYAKIATVITADIGIAGQLAPGDRVRFEMCTALAARGALMERELALMALETTS